MKVRALLGQLAVPTLLGLLSLSSLGCATKVDAARRVSRDDPRTRAIKADCARLHAQSKQAAHLTRECVDRRLDAVARLPDAETRMTARERREAGCRLEAKAHVARACLDSLDAERELDAGGPVTPEERRELDLARCRTMGKLAYVQECEARVRARGGS